MGDDLHAEIYYIDWLTKKYEYLWHFPFFKDDFINIQYSNLWNTLKTMFTKYPIKWKRIGRNSWKCWYWFNLESIELDIKI